MNPPDSAAGEPGPDVPEPALPAAAALSLTRRFVMPPLVLSLVVSIAAVTSFLVLAMPLEGEVGEALNPWFDRFLGNAFSAAIAAVFLAAVLYAALQNLGVAVDRNRFRLLDVPPRTASSSWLALLSGRSFFPGIVADDRETTIHDDSYAAEERYGLTRRRYVDQGLAPLRFIVWVLPMLGFIGTVVGISGSITGLESVIGSDGGRQAAAGLITVLEGLRFAFDTTLLGLGTVIPVMALLTILERREDALTGEGCDRVQALLAGAEMVQAGGDQGTMLLAPDRTAAGIDGSEA
jgi:hypothetical protein